MSEETQKPALVSRWAVLSLVVRIILTAAFFGFALWFNSLAIWSLLDPYGFPYNLICCFLAPIPTGVALILWSSCCSTSPRTENDFFEIECVFATVPLYFACVTIFFLIYLCFPKIVQYHELNMHGHWFLFGTMIIMFLSVSFNEFLKRWGQLGGDLTISKLRNYLKHYKIALFIFYVVLTFSAFITVAVSPPMPVSQKHLTYEQLPYYAPVPIMGSDFCYKRSYRGTFYWDFHIEEDDFRNWMKSREDWPELDDITPDSSRSVWSCLENKKIEITDGLYTQYGQGAGAVAAFDRKTNRAYHWTYY